MTRTERERSDALGVSLIRSATAILGPGESLRAAVETAVEAVGPERVALWLDGDRAEMGRRIEAARKVGR